MSTHRSAVVTGAASGIGLGVAALLRGRGYRVVAVDRPDVDLAPLESRLGGDVEVIQCDLADAVALGGLCDALGTREDVEVLVANAGVVLPGAVAEKKREDIDLELDVNLRSSLHLIRAVVPGLVAMGRGHVLATVSMGGILPLPESATYSATKAGLRAFLAALNCELAGTGVRVSGIYPAAVDTPLLRWEAAHGGSALNFVGSVLSVERIVAAYAKALDTGRLEVYAPWSDSVTTRLGSAFPAILPRIIPLVNRIGERGRTRFLEQKRRQP